MTCYKCGDPNSPDGKLCLKCTKKKLEEITDLDALSIDPDTHGNSSDSFITTTKILSLLLIILGAGVYFFYYQPELISPDRKTATPESEIAYRRCQYKIKDKLEKRNIEMTSKLGNNLDPEQKKVLDRLSSDVETMGAKLCDKFRAECGNNPSGERCQMIINEDW